MDRDLRRMADTTFDLVVVGGGIIGLAVAREAALRGLATALVEKGDFGGATSGNSLKLIHGGLRYLQHADLPRLRQSVRERRFFLHGAPHLVHPLSFLVPTYGHALKGPEAMAAAFRLYSLLAADRNRGVPPERRILPGRVVDAGECLRLFPGFRREGLNGGAVFQDGQVANLDRLTLLFALAAHGAGAALANHVRCQGFLLRNGSVAGIRARDELTGQELEIGARLVINAAGPWTDGLLRGLPRPARTTGYLLAKAVNVVVGRSLGLSCAVGLECPDERSDSLVGRGGRLFFLTPWRQMTLIGTTYHTWRDDPDRLTIGEEDLTEVLESINRAWPEARLTLDDVVFHHLGMVPITAETGPSGVHLAKDDVFIDHRREGLEGLLSVVGVKYTTARDVARRAVNTAGRRLGVTLAPEEVSLAPLPGGEMESPHRFLATLPPAPGGGVDAESLTRLAALHGTLYPQVLDCGREGEGLLQPLPGAPLVLGAQVAHAVRREMARRLPDVVLRRTELALHGRPPDEALTAAARIMAAELGWDAGRVEAEVGDARRSFAWGGGRCGA
jgi:glycerol-3-phosphate dehydrogenase